MDNIQTINFRKARDFSAKLNATFEFIRQNYMSLAKSILYIAGPAIVLLGIFSGYYQKYALDLTQIFQGDMFLSEGFYISIGGMIVFGFISQLLMITVMLEYVNLYNEKQTNEISVEEVWDRTKGSLGKVTISTILFFVILLMISFIIGMLIASTGNSPVLMVLLFFILVPFLFYIVISIAIFFNILLHEKPSLSEFGNIVKRCFYLIKDKWWSTFGLIFIAGILRGVMSVVFSIPMLMVMFFTAVTHLGPGQSEIQPMWHEISLVLASIIATLGSSLLYAIPVIALTFQYFNLVELKDATGLMSEIDGIGTIIQEDESEEEY